MLTVSKIFVCSKQVSTLSLPKKNGGRLSFAFHLLHFLVGEARVAHAIGWKIAGVHLKRSNLSKGCKTLFCTGSNLGELNCSFCSQKWSYNWLYSADWQLRTHWNSHMTAGTNEPKAFSHIFQLSQFVLLFKMSLSQMWGTISGFSPYCWIRLIHSSCIQMKWFPLHCFAFQCIGEENPGDWWLKLPPFEVPLPHGPSPRGTGIFCWTPISFGGPSEPHLSQMTFTPPQAKLILWWKIPLNDDKVPFNSLSVVQQARKAHWPTHWLTDRGRC